MYKKVILVLLIFFNFCSLNTWAWNDKRTHYDLSIKASEHSVLSSTGGDYLKNLGFSNNIKEPFSLNGETKLVKEWIGEGGIEEDAGNVFTAYYYNHFHNPRFSWDQAGLKTYYPWINGMSSILWAQNASNPWNWQKAREYYYLALTSQSDTQRQENFANTFKGLGHIIHLIQDSAQPAHVRNDPHPLDDWGIVPQFENWTKDPKNQTIVSSFISNPVFPTVSLDTPVGSYTPITQLWDINKYNGTNPNEAIGNSIGISEYTNANFFSENTIFTEPYPAWPSVVEYDKEIDANTGELRTYLKKTGDGETIQHLAAGRWFYKYLPVEYKHLGLKLDDNVYKDYASLLLPRAVGYSASLLNYFFRGQMNMDKDPNNSSLYVIKNESDEYMSGTFTLYYDDATDNRRYLTSWNKTINPNSTSDSVTFTEPTDAKERGKYILIFQGTMGNETGAVAGKMVKVEECIKPEEIEIIYENNILKMKNCKGEWIPIYTIGCIPSSEEAIKAVKKRDNTSSFVVTQVVTQNQAYRMYIVEITKELEERNGDLFRKLNCSLYGEYVGSSDTWTSEYTSDITSSGGYGLVDITISSISTSNSTGSISYSVTKKANGEWAFVETTKGVSSSTSQSTRILTKPVFDAPQSWYSSLKWYYPGDGYGESANSCFGTSKYSNCYFRLFPELLEFYSNILGSESASETKTSSQLIGGSTSVDLFTGETISYEAPRETSSCQYREVGESIPPLYDNLGDSRYDRYIPLGETFCDTYCGEITVWAFIPRYIGEAVYWNYERYLKLSEEDKKRIMIQQYDRIISSMMRGSSWQNCQ